MTAALRRAQPEAAEGAVVTWRGRADARDWLHAALAFRATPEHPRPVLVEIYPSSDADLWRVTLEEGRTCRIDLAGLTDGHAELFQRTATTPHSEASYERVAESSPAGGGRPEVRITHRVPDSVPGLTTHDIIVTGQGRHGDTYTLRVVRVDAPPTSSDREVETPFDTAYTFKAADFGFEDPDEEDSLASVTVVTTPGKGTLALGGTWLSYPTIPPGTPVPRPIRDKPPPPASTNSIAAKVRCRAPQPSTSADLTLIRCRHRKGSCYVNWVVTKDTKIAKNTPIYKCSYWSRPVVASVPDGPATRRD